MTYYDTLDSPLGSILLTSDGQALTGLYLSEHKHGEEVRPGWLHNDNTPPFADVKAQLAAYFSGTLVDFDLPLAPAGTTFQQSVWRELLSIPYGETVSYGKLAGRLGNPGASRAVGLANGRNPISIIVPCHRVIGADGKLTGYGGGLPRKAALLAFEKAVLLHGPGAFSYPVPETSDLPDVQLALDFSS
ncbi:MAG TPA: methylated-DNA--[protein]-cysteine S-methyltransferase [Chloroflexia bacterium]|nr:methylated-DNA--[protein]-cysteine S-methyltransferase [Chloroflexia bacterium]